MWLYLIIFIIPVIAYLTGPAENRNNRFLQIYMLALMLFVGLSDMFGGYDRYIYAEVFDNLADAITNEDEASILYLMDHFEVGFSTLSYLLGFLTENRYIYIFILTMLSYFFMYKAFEKSMPNYPMAMIIFLGMAFFFTFTYLRQVLAFSIAWYSTRFLLDKKWIKFILTTFLVALLHKSGIIFLGVALIPLKKCPPFIVILILLICGTIGWSGITGKLYDAYATVSEMELTNAYSTENNMRIAYILEVIFFTWLILTNYHKIPPTRINLIFLNMAWCFCAILLLFVKSSEGGRVAWYFIMGIIYIVTLICSSKEISRNLIITQTINKNQKLISSLMIVLMLGLYVRVYTGWQSANYLYPYKTFLTNGYRSNDTCREAFEYDYLYDQDKFYRPAFRFLE